jgi:triphosphoribosyl-dephospho-CoA synthetase
MACFQRYGSEGSGIRKEAEGGLPSVFEQGLPELKSALAGTGELVEGSQMNSVLTRTLLRLMAATSDTNILYRKDIQTLRKVQHLAQRVLEAENHEVEAKRYARLMDYCLNLFRPRPRICWQ